MRNRELQVDLETGICHVAFERIARIGTEDASEQGRTNMAKEKTRSADTSEANRRKIEFGNRFIEILCGYFVDFKSGKTEILAVPLHFAVIDVVVLVAAEVVVG